MVRAIAGESVWFLRLAPCQASRTSGGFSGLFVRSQQATRRPNLPGSPSPFRVSANASTFREEVLAFDLPGLTARSASMIGGDTLLGSVRKGRSEAAESEEHRCRREVCRAPTSPASNMLVCLRTEMKQAHVRAFLSV
jgi:hypothetical protein